MKLVEFNWCPSDRQLRQFGFCCLLLLPFIGWLWGGSPTLVTLLLVFGLVLAVVGLLKARALKPIFVVSIFLAIPIGLIVSELALLVVYFGVVLPIGLVFRLTQRDSLRPRLDKKAKTYWLSKVKSKDVASYFRQS